MTATQRARRQPPRPTGQTMAPDQAQSSVTVTQETITPEMAETWLSANSHNRPIRQGAVDNLVGIIQRGEWVLNGDSIKWSRHGVLLDGQHRLWAIVMADQAVPSLVTRGLDPDSQLTMDTGLRRTLGDHLKLRGETGGLPLGAVISTKWRYDAGLIRTTAKPSVPQALATLEANPGLRDAQKMAAQLRRRFRVSVGHSGVVWYECDTIDPDSVAVFWEKLLTGSALDPGDPILALRGYMERQTLSSTGARTSALVTMAMMFKAWNAWREGRQVEHLIWRTTGAQAEAFPVPK